MSDDADKLFETYGAEPREQLVEIIGARDAEIARLQAKLDKLPDLVELVTAAWKNGFDATYHDDINMCDEIALASSISDAVREQK